MRIRFRRPVTWLAFALLTGCSGGAGGGAATTVTAARDASAEEGYAAEGAPAAVAADSDVVTADRATRFSAARATAESPPPADEVVPATADVEVAKPDAALRAGSVDDNARFADYLDYRRRFAKTGIEVHDRDISERHVVRVLDADRRPVLGAQISLLHDGNVLQVVRSHADGRALLHPLVSKAPKAEQYAIKVQRGAAAVEIPLDDRSVRNHEVVLDAAEPAANRLDIHFLIDATGSMGDEIDRLKTTMTQVAARITGLPARPDVRWGMTAYRDRGEAFVTRTSPFSGDLKTFTRELATLQALDGGDPPEALNQALHAAVHEPEWDSDNAVQIIFLIADAPPHLDYPDDEDYAVDMFAAAERGIAIVPIASSGLDDQGEYVFRQLAQVTYGRFMFLTYGPNGQPGDSTTHDVSGYEVQSLDELVVQYVAEQLAHREPAEDQQ